MSNSTTIQYIKTIGTEITSGNTIQEVMEEGGIDWYVSKRPMATSSTPNVGQSDLRHPPMLTALEIGERLQLDNAAFMPIPNHYAIVRDDNNEVLGVMQSGYLPVQNIECMNIIEPLFESGDLQIRRIGLFDQGQNVWVLCRMPIKMEIGNDEMIGTAKLSWSHDGSERVTIRFMAWSNRFKVYISPKINEKKITNIISVRHTKNAKERISIAEDIISTGQVYFKKLNEKLEEMIEEPQTAEEFETILEKMFPTKGKKEINEDGYEEDEIGNRALTIRSRVHQEIKDIYNTQEPDILGTKFAALVAICDHAENQGSIRVQGRDNMTEDQARTAEAQQRLKNSWNGTADKIKQRAFDLLMKG